MPPAPPPLPRSLADPRPAVTVGTLTWFVAALVFVVADAPAGWVWTSLVGGLLGFVGFIVMHLQRNAAQRGLRGGGPDLF